MADYREAVRAMQESQHREALLNWQLQLSSASLLDGASESRNYPGPPYPQQGILPPHMLGTLLASNPSLLLSMTTPGPHTNFFAAAAAAAPVQSHQPRPLPPIAAYPQHQLAEGGGGSHPRNHDYQYRLGPQAPTAATWEPPSGERRRQPREQKRRSRISDPFPVRLHRLLLDMELQGKQDIASFTPSGKSFRVHKPDEFVRDILPKYFRQKNFASFKRQLNMYGFNRVLGGRLDGGDFHHASFQRGEPDLCKAMLPKGSVLLDSEAS